jgi:cytochrome c
MNDPLFFNKVAGALLAAALLYFGIPQLGNAVLGKGGHHGAGHELKLAYPIEFAKEGGGATGPQPVADLGTLLAAASPDAGKRRVGLCTSCHNFEKGGADMQGPHLWDVVGRPIASAAGFKYSAALSGMGGAWTYEQLDRFLQSPQKAAPGTAMSFAGIAKAEQRAEILAYLRSLSDTPVDFPAPAAPVAGEAPPADHATDGHGEQAPG